jgi:hypothetical protein
MEREVSIFSERGDSMRANVGADIEYLAKGLAVRKEELVDDRSQRG